MKKTKKHSSKKPLSPAKFEKKFDAGEDITEHLDLSQVRAFAPGEERLNLEIKKVNLDIPQWMIDGLDHAAERIGVTRQSIIKIWLADRLQGKAA